MEDYKLRMIEEYKELKARRESLHRILIKNEAGTLDFELNCPVKILMLQEQAMEQYMHVLEVRAEIESVDLWNA